MATVRARPAERAASLPGDGIVPDASVVMDRAFTLPAPPVEVWPWFVQLGKGRGGWYLPRAVERVIPPRRRALRALDPRLTTLAVGDVIDDWGGRDAYFEVAIVEEPHALVHRSRRRHIELSWAIVLDPQPPSSTRVHIRLRLAGVRHASFAAAGDLFDAVTIAGLAAGLRERLRAAGA